MTPTGAWAPDIAGSKITVARVHSIAFTPMSKRLRNELITQAYGDMAEELVTMLGQDLTWPAFGQWASHTVGGVLDRNVPVLGPLVSRSFAHGNQAVFADIGSACAVFCEVYGPIAKLPVGRRFDALHQAREDFAQGVADSSMAPPGLLPSAESGFMALLNENDPQEAVRGELLAGFDFYGRAMAEPDPELRSQLVLAGNVVLAAHEQRLLAHALSLGFRELPRAFTRPNLLVASTRSWRSRPPTDRQLRIEARWIKWATANVVAVRLPWARVRVGRPVPAGSNPIPIPEPRRTRKGYAAMNAGDLLASLAQRFKLDDSPATVWNDFDDRMRYIMALFAQHQRSPQWFSEGQLLRPKTWSKLDDGVAAIDRLVQERAPQPETHTDTAGQLDEHRKTLNELRQVRTIPKVAQPAPLTDLRRIEREALAPYRRAAHDDISQRLEQLQQPGGLLDATTCRRARRLFAGHETLMFMGLFVRSLPEAYASANGATVVGTVSDLNRDPLRRAGETAQFVADLLARSNTWDQQSLAFKSVCGVRTMHAIVANHLEGAGWDNDNLGVPVNAADVLGTALSFAVPVFEMFEELGVPIGSRRRDAYVRFWLGVGVLLGVPLEVVQTSGGTPLGYHEAKELAQAIRIDERERSLMGVRLQTALVEGIAQGLPRGLGWVSSGISLAMGDDEVTDLLLIDQGPGERRSVLLSRVLQSALRPRGVRRATKVGVSVVGRWALRPFFDEGRGRPYRRPQRPAEERPGSDVKDRFDPALCWPEGAPVSWAEVLAAAGQENATQSDSGGLRWRSMRQRVGRTQPARWVARAGGEGTLRRGPQAGLRRRPFARQ